MKISCRKAELLENLQKIEGAVGIKTTLPVLNNFLLETSENHLQLTATDLELTIECGVKNINIIDSGSITIPAKKFIDIIRELPDSDIVVDVNEKNNITIKCDKIIYKIMGLPKSEYPPIVDLKKEAINLKINKAILKEMIKKTIFSVSLDETRKVLTGVLLVVENNEMKMVGTDGHRLAFFKSASGKTANAKIIIPTKVLNEMQKFLKEDENDVDIAIYENKITFKFDNLVITSRLIDGQYPSYEQIINRVFDKKVKVNTEVLTKAVKRVSLLAVDKASAIKIKAFDEKLIINATAADVGEAEEEIAADYKGEEITIAFNAKYIADVLKVIGAEDVEIQLKDTMSAGLVKAPNAENYLYIIMPVRI
ncbi:MAG: DNA polymerase III subunit beta [Candidatus Firestonebacteria bacterium]